MREIRPKDAKELYKIWTAHHEMQKGGELRFRMSSADGTRSIRTVRTMSAGGEWQDAHYHCSVRETYIVQSGWIAFVELREDVIDLQVLIAGAIVTTEPLVHHNVYMPAGAIIHTVKHGTGHGEDKEEAPELTEWCKLLRTEAEICARVTRSSVQSESDRPIYDESYRHFDTLIWQMPGWSTAIFLGSAAVLGQANRTNLTELLPGFTPESLTSGFLIVISAFMFGLTQSRIAFGCIRLR